MIGDQPIGHSPRAAFLTAFCPQNLVQSLVLRQRWVSAGQPVTSIGKEPSHWHVM